MHAHSEFPRQCQSPKFVDLAFCHKHASLFWGLFTSICPGSPLRFFNIIPGVRSMFSHENTFPGVLLDLA